MLPKEESNIMLDQILGSFAVDPATSDFQRGYLKAVIDIAEKSGTYVHPDIIAQLKRRMPGAANPARDAQRQAKYEERENRGW